MNLKIVYSRIVFIISIFIFSFNVQSKEHPNLLLTKKGVADIRDRIKDDNESPFYKSLIKIQKEMDIVLSNPLVVPLPKDAGGGYTHEKHKQNASEMQQMGVMYQIYQDEKYAAFVRNMLMEYAKMYPTLGLHPVQKSNYRGKLFWQGLNECVWLVSTAQAYDCVYDYLSDDDRKNIEENLFYPMIKFISEDNSETFNRIHNHGTWAVAGVGMIGYVMNNEDVVQKSLYGSNKDAKSGFIKQIDQLFSPDGYFEEGPYYQRYSLQPFIMFAQVVDNNNPELKIFEYRERVLEKAVTTLLQMADSNGVLFLLNDALYKTWKNSELVYGVDIAYNISRDKKLLSIAKEQKRVILTDAGLTVSDDLAKGLEKTFEQRTLLIKDGPDGKRGGLGILRSGRGGSQTTALMKATSQGMGHGHFDKLTISLYNNGKEILRDYGAARYVNIEAKNGGHYLPENDKWAKQTIAHNTLVVDEVSNYDGELKIAEKFWPTITSFVDKNNYKEVSATETNAYKGVAMSRKLVMLETEEFKHPLIIDIFDVNSAQTHQYDLPFHYTGQIMSTNFDYSASLTNMQAFGAQNGYQYLWKEAEGKSDKHSAKLTFLTSNRFYTITTLTSPNTQLFLARVGANDPDFNLRREPCFIIREKAKQKTFLTVIEAHGEFEADAERSRSTESNIKDIKFTDAKQKQVIITTNNAKEICVDLEKQTYTVKNLK